MISQRRSPSNSNSLGVQGKAPQRESRSNNDPGEGDKVRKQSWADGFLTSNGMQMPLFVRPAIRFKHS
jgi:hypothetical protein